MLAWRLARRELRGGLGGFARVLRLPDPRGRRDRHGRRAQRGRDRRPEAGRLGAARRRPQDRGAATCRSTEAELAGADARRRARRSASVRTNAMAEAGGGRRVVVALKAVDAAYPLLRRGELDPPTLSLRSGARRSRASWSNAACSPGSGSGSATRSGSGRPEFVIRAVLEREPDRIGGYISIGPRAMIGLDQLARTRVILPGSLAQYGYGLALPAGVDANAWLAHDPQRASGCPLAGARHPRHPAPDHPLHRPARDLSDARRPDGAADRRGRRGARDPELSGRQDRDHRHAEVPGRLERPGVPDLPPADPGAGRDREPARPCDRAGGALAAERAAGAGAAGPDRDRLVSACRS